jgi:hypothetical protein
MVPLPLLRRREAEVVDLERRESEARQTIEARDQVALLVAREARFLQTLAVRHQRELSIVIGPHYIER